MSTVSAGALGTWNTCESTTPGHPRQGARDLCSLPEGGILIRARDSHIDRRRLPKVQHLIDDVGRLEKELQFGKSGRQLLAQRRVMIFAVGVCFSFSGNQYLAVHRPHGCRIAQRDDDAAVGQSDVVEHHVDLLVA